jgi:hypothetical protein
MRRYERASTIVTTTSPSGMNSSKRLRGFRRYGGVMASGPKLHLEKRRPTRKWSGPSLAAKLFTRLRCQSGKFCAEHGRHAARYYGFLKMEGS